MHPSFCLLLLLVYSIHGLTKNRNSLSHDLQFDLESKLTCFWEEFTGGDKLQVSIMSIYEMKLLIQLRVTSPTGSISDWESGDRGARLAYNLTETGIYEICVHSSVKTRVALYIFAYNEEKLIEGVSKYTELQRTGEQIQKSMVSLHEKMYRTLHEIKYSTLSMGRDERLQKKNADYIKRYTIAFILLNLIIGIVQIFVIRRFFRDVNTGKVRI